MFITLSYVLQWCSFLIFFSTVFCKACLSPIYISLYDISLSGTCNSIIVAFSFSIRIRIFSFSIAVLYSQRTYLHLFSTLYLFQAYIKWRGFDMCGGSSALLIAQSSAFILSIFHRIVICWVIFSYFHYYVHVYAYVCVYVYVYVYVSAIFYWALV